MSDVQVHLIQKINTVKKSFLNQDESDASERFARLEKFSQHLQQVASEEFLLLDPLARLMTPDFYLNKLVPVLSSVFHRVSRNFVGSDPTFRNHPTGLHAVVLSSRVLITEICELLMTSLAAGNFLFFHLRSDQEKLFIKLQALLTNVGLSAECLSWIVDDKNEVKNFFYQHPAFRLATFFDLNKEIESQLSVVNLLDRKWQLFRGGKSLAIVLSGANHELAAQVILNSIRQGQGLLSQNISRILIVEQEEASFKAELLRQVTNSNFLFNFENQSRLDLMSKTLTDDKARQITTNSSIHLFENISNCSEFHQIELQAPICFLQSIRYGFDSIKWIQATPNCIGVQLFGADDKIAKISEKLSTPYVWKNSWIESQDFSLLGSSGGFAGHLDPNWNGSFYSNWTKF